MTEKNLAQTTYETLLKAIEALNWKCVHDDKNLTAHYPVIGDMPMEFFVLVDGDRQLLRLMSKMPFSFPHARINAGAIATSYANYHIFADGYLELNMQTGETYFKMTTSFKGTTLSEEAVIYMLSYACQAVDSVNKKLFGVASGSLTVEQYINLINEIS